MRTRMLLLICLFALPSVVISADSFWNRFASPKTQAQSKYRTSDYFVLIDEADYYFKPRMEIHIRLIKNPATIPFSPIRKIIAGARVFAKRTVIWMDDIPYEMIEYSRYSKDGSLWLYGGAACLKGNCTCAVPDKPVMMMPNYVVEGKTYVYSHTDKGYDDCSVSSSHYETSTTRIRSTFSKVERVRTPLGTIHALKFDSEFYMKDTSVNPSEPYEYRQHDVVWSAKDIGMIRLRSSFAENSVFLLEKAKFNGVAYPAGSCQQPHYMFEKGFIVGRPHDAGFVCGIARHQMHLIGSLM